MRIYATGAQHHNWLGNDISYGGIHQWAKKHVPRTGRCADCGCNRTTRRIDLANRDHTYRRDPDNWIELCTKCHYVYDLRNGLRELPSHCPRGHAYNKKNTYYNAHGSRTCRVCNRERYHENKQLRGPSQRPCMGCGGHPDESTPGCQSCYQRHWYRRKKALL